MSTTTIAGKPSNTIGEKDSTLVLRGSSIKIQWGNKFIDLIKNGKINSDSLKLLKTADTVEELTTDGLYLVGDSVWAVIGGTKVLLSGDSTTTYVSYLTEQKDITGELKERALTNIGFYYETLEEANAAGLTSGIIYVKGDNKLYFIKDGILTEYINTLSSLPSTENTESTEDTESTENLYIEGNSLWVGNDKYITCDDNTYINEPLILEQGLQSSNASSKLGYKLYMKNGLSYLEVDNIILRNLKVDSNITIQPTKYYLEENIILKTVEETETEIISDLTITLLYSNKYKIGDILTTFILLDTEVEYTNEDGEIDTKTEKTLAPLDFKIVSIGENNTYSVSTSSDKITLSNISQLVNKPIYYKLGELPVARISDHNYDLFRPNIDQTLENISLRIGSLQELEVSLLGKKISEYTKEDLGIYSDNAFLKNPYLFESSQYNTIFKNGNDVYPKYDEGWFIPDDSDDLTIVTSLWVNDKIEPIKNDISDINDEIEDIWDKIDSLENDENTGEDAGGATEEDLENILKLIDNLLYEINLLKKGSYSSPVVLLSGKLVASYSTGMNWYFSGSKHEGILNVITTRVGGKLNIELLGPPQRDSEGNLLYDDNGNTIPTKNISISSVMANLYSSPYTLAHDADEKESGYDPASAGYRENGHGSHWFETRWNYNTFSIREFHQEDRNNNTWQSGNWHEQSCREVSIIVIGYIY